MREKLEGLDSESLIRGLVVREPWASRIVDGHKSWEIRGIQTRIRGPIAIIAGGTSTILGMAVITEVVGPLSLEQYRNQGGPHGVLDDGPTQLPYPLTFAWVLATPVRFAVPVAYDHPSGAVIWVRFNSAVQAAIRRALG